MMWWWVSLQWYERKRARSSQGTIKLLPRETKKHIPNFSRLHTADAQPEFVTESLTNTILDHWSFTDFLVDIFLLVKLVCPKDFPAGSYRELVQSGPIFASVFLDLL